MANYTATTRSNFFSVKDEAAFRAAIDALPDVCIIEREDVQAGKQFAIHCNNGNGDGWPTYSFDEESGEDIEVDLLGTVSSHLASDSIAVLMEAGSEAMRYIVGSARAVDSLGNEVHVDLDDIYDLAAKKLKGAMPTWS